MTNRDIRASTQKSHGLPGSTSRSDVCERGEQL